MTRDFSDSFFGEYARVAIEDYLGQNLHERQMVQGQKDLAQKKQSCDLTNVRLHVLKEKKKKKRVGRMA